MNKCKWFLTGFCVFSSHLAARIEKGPIKPLCLNVMWPGGAISSITDKSIY